MHEEGQPKTFHIPNFPDGVEEIVRAVREHIKDRPEEYGAKEVMDAISGRGLPPDLGILINKQIENMRRPQPDLTGKNREAIDWAAEQYFKLLLTDLRRFPKYFVNHQEC